MMFLQYTSPSRKVYHGLELPCFELDLRQSTVEENPPSPFYQLSIMLVLIEFLRNETKRKRNETKRLSLETIILRNESIEKTSAIVLIIGYFSSITTSTVQRK
jgi:hypothetical protein